MSPRLRISACVLLLVVRTDGKGSGDLLFETVKIAGVSKRASKRIEESSERSFEQCIVS